MRLIDAEELVEEMIKEELFPSFTRSEVQILKFAERMVEYAPTIDAVPVVHGKWIDRKEFGCECNRCGMRFYDLLSDYRFAYNYCPYCGSRMDGENDGAD